MNNSKDKILTIPNVLTLLRVPIGLGGILLYFAGSELAGVLVLAFAGFTDFLDGYIARKTNSVSDFGKKIDPIFDKIYTFMVSIFVLAISDSMIAKVTISSVIFAELLNAGLYMKSVLVDKEVKYEVSKVGKYAMAGKMVSIWSFAFSAVASQAYSDLLTASGVFAGMSGSILSIYAFTRYYKIQSN